MHSSVVPDSIYGYIVQHVAAGDPGHYLLLNSEVIEYIRIRFGFESFSSNLEYSDSDSRILETE